jgi:hypothetical protein
MSTPKGGWFRSKPSSSQATEEAPRSGHYPSSQPRVSVKKAKRQIILSQSMVIDTDLNKVEAIFDLPQYFLARLSGSFFLRNPYTEKRAC